jgi:hypothetical protein
MEIKLDASMIRNEIQEKLKNLKKFEASEEFTAIKEYCSKEVEKLEKQIRKELKTRRTKTEKHEAIFSELDLMIKNQEFLEMLQSKSKDKAFLKEISDNIEALESHLFLQSGNFDFCVYSELDGLKHEYKLNMGIEHTVKQMITKYELQDKEIDLESSTNAYAAPKPVSGELNI